MPSDRPKPSLGAQRSDPWPRARRSGLLRYARNDGPKSRSCPWAVGHPAQDRAPAAEGASRHAGDGGPVYPAQAIYPMTSTGVTGLAPSVGRCVVVAGQHGGPMIGRRWGSGKVAAIRREGVGEGQAWAGRRWRRTVSDQYAQSLASPSSRRMDLASTVMPVDALPFTTAAPRPGRRPAARNKKGGPAGPPRIVWPGSNDQKSLRYCSLPMKPSLVIADRLTTASVLSTTS